jgi:hypothetical protein
MVKVENVRVEDLDYTVVSDRDLPEELMTIIQEKKGEGFEFTYEYEGYLYIAKGYGKQDTGGYSITVNDLYLGKNAIYVEMDLYGPETIDEMAEGVSYPYIVCKLEGRTEPVIFL